MDAAKNSCLGRRSAAGVCCWLPASLSLITWCTVGQLGVLLRDSDALACARRKFNADGTECADGKHADFLAALAQFPIYSLLLRAAAPYCAALHKNESKSQLSLSLARRRRRCSKFRFSDSPSADDGRERGKSRSRSGIISIFATVFVLHPSLLLRWWVVLVGGL